MGRRRVYSVAPMSAYDFVVVGGGSSGCVVAAELAADGRTSVLLLEAGDAAERNPETLRADGYKDAFINDRVIAERFSIPQPHCGNQRLFMGSGRGMGGSGSVNAMVYTRGAREDFDAFPAGWRWNDVVPDFEAVEAVLRPRRREPTDWTERAIRAAEAAGFRRKGDLNDGDLSGVLGYEWMNYEGDRRRSAYVAFIKDRGPRPNLTVITNARVHRLTTEGGRVTGVVYEREGARASATARREVVLAAGALETPKILMLSGIGPAPVLRRHGIPVVRDVDGVGKNLHDHPNVATFYLGKRPVDCNYPQLYGFHRVSRSLGLPAGQSDTCYVFYPARSSLKEASKRILPGQIIPERFYGPRSRGAVRRMLDVVWGTGLADPIIDRVYGIVVILGKPKSRGTITLRSASPTDDAILDPAYFAEREDLDAMVEGVRLAKRIAGGAPLGDFGNLVLAPRARADRREAIARWIEKNAMTTYHFAGTCRMGEDAASVVDTRLRFRGVSGLRVADASVIPVAPVAALNAPSMLCGYRAARFIREEAGDRPATEARGG
jgi:choline dehydrogenase